MSGEEFKADVNCKLCMMFKEAVVAVVGWTEFRGISKEIDWPQFWTEQVENPTSPH